MAPQREMAPERDKRDRALYHAGPQLLGRKSSHLAL